MGSPKQIRRKYEGPRHPWQRKRIETEREILKGYGLANKAEIWKMTSLLKGFTGQAKRLFAVKTMQGELEKRQLFQRLEKVGLLKPGSALDDILGLTIEDILNRRLQTLVYKKGLARTIKQARQFIIHNHIICGGQLVTVPSYLVPVGDEATVSFLLSSTLAKEDHPERVKLEKKPKKRGEKSNTEK